MDEHPIADAGIEWMLIADDAGQTDLAQNAGYAGTREIAFSIGDLDDLTWDA
jgi:hypothetical protein